MFSSGVKRIQLERSSAKYYSIMVDAIPDSSHVEQTTFIIRYLASNQGQIEILERFLTFAVCSEKTLICNRQFDFKNFERK